MKIKLVSILLISSMVLASTGALVHGNERYPSETEGISNVDLILELGEGGGPPLPPGPGEPETIEPEETNPNNGELSLRYVSNLNFGTAEVSTSSQTIYAKKDEDKNGISFNNRVSIQDFRNDESRDGWMLTVTRKGNFIPGSTIKMSPKIDEEAARQTGVSAGNSFTIENTDSFEFARTISNDNPSGSVTMTMADPDSNGVELEIPANTPANKYSTQLLWNLTNGPLPVDPENR